MSLPIAAIDVPDWVAAAWIAIGLCGIVALAKGKWGTFLFGAVAAFFTLSVGSLVWVVAAIRLAKPNSLWAGGFYGEDMMAKAKKRSEPSRRATVPDGNVRMRCTDCGATMVFPATWSTVTCHACKLRQSATPVSVSLSAEDRHRMAFLAGMASGAIHRKH